MKPTVMRITMVLIAALCLTIFPLPLLNGIKPPWVLLFILYMQFYLPEQFNLVTVIFVGFILDVLLATVIGEHILAFSLVTWLASTKARRFYFFSIGQQMALIGFCCLSYQLIIVTIDAFLGFNINLVPIAINTVIGLLIWPWLCLIIDDVLRRKSKPFRS